MYRWALFYVREPEACAYYYRSQRGSHGIARSVHLMSRNRSCAVLIKHACSSPPPASANYEIKSPPIFTLIPGNPHQVLLSSLSRSWSAQIKCASLLLFPSPANKEIKPPPHCTLIRGNDQLSPSLVPQLVVRVLCK